MLTDDDNNKSEDSESASTGDDDTIGAPANSTRKIPKPAGEPGRPGSGGYNIETQLQGWTPDLVTNVNKFVKLKADATLDTTKSYSKQKPSDITAICIQTKKNYPIVNKYENYWPVRDMLKLHLKYTSEVYRKQGVAIRKMQKTRNN